MQMSTKWKKIRIELKDTTEDAIEWLCYELNEMGVESIEIRENSRFEKILKENESFWDGADSKYVEEIEEIKKNPCLICYIPIDTGTESESETEKILKNVRDYAAEKGCRYTEETTQTEDWQKKVQEQYEPISIGESIIIIPSWDTGDYPQKTVLKIQPGVGFGTGQHPTTRMMLLAMEKETFREKNVLDLGCGNGILSIAAKIMGAEKVYAWDVDEKAITAAKENVKENALTDQAVQFIAGDFTEADNTEILNQHKPYDIITANLVTSLFLSNGNLFGGLLSPGGKLICSGIRKEYDGQVKTILESSGLRFISESTEEEWCCLQFSKKES